MIRFIFASLLLLSTGYCQEVKQLERYAPFEPIVISVEEQLPEGVKLSVIWDLPTVKYIGVSNTTAHIWAAPGKHHGYVLVWKIKSIKIGDEVVDVLVGAPIKRDVDFVVGDTPLPPPGPDPGPQPPGPTPSPTIPDDQFNNIGKRVYEWSKGLPKRAELGAVYREYSNLIMIPNYLSVNELSGNLLNKRNQVLGPDLGAYTQFGKNLLDDIKSRKFDRTDLSLYWQAVALGLETK